MDVLLTLFNGGEAILWMALATILAVHSRTASSNLRRASWVAAILLVAFGLSDLIEIQTGAWWQPPALLIFKGLCLVGLIASTAWIIALQRLIAQEKDRG